MNSHSTFVIETSDLVKTFGDTRAVDGVDLAVPTGMVYGLLGPNGAGKTTVIRVLATLLRPDAGTARVFGCDVVREADAVRSRVSLTGQFASVDEDLTGLENLVLIARLLGYSRKHSRERASELLDAFGLTKAAGRQVSKYSGGMRRRLDIAASIVVKPDFMFLDEPTAGLDLRSRNQVWDIIRALVAGGTTVLLTTQYLDEADQLADRIAVIDRGKVIAEGTPGELKALVGSGALHVRLFDPEDRSDAERVLSETLGVPVCLESDPAALSARVSLRPCLRPRTRRARLHGAVPLWRYGHRVRPRPAEPRRGVPCTDRPPCRRRRCYRGGRRMTTPTTSASPIREETLRSALSAQPATVADLIRSAVRANA